MPIFNLNKIRSAGLRYIVADRSGQAWAFEQIPERKDGAWILNKAVRCPNESSEEYHKYWAQMHRYYAMGREFAIPVFDLPFEITWEDEPYDIVEHGLVPECDLKKWY